MPSKDIYVRGTSIVTTGPKIEVVPNPVEFGLLPNNFPTLSGGQPIPQGQQFIPREILLAPNPNDINQAMSLPNYTPPTGMLPQPMTGPQSGMLPQSQQVPMFNQGGAVRRYAPGGEVINLPTLAQSNAPTTSSIGSTFQDKYKDRLVLVLVQQTYLEKRVLEICLGLKLVQQYLLSKQYKHLKKYLVKVEDLEKQQMI